MLAATRPARSRAHRRTVAPFLSNRSGGRREGTTPPRLKHSAREGVGVIGTLCFIGGRRTVADCGDIARGVKGALNAVATLAHRSRAGHRSRARRGAPSNGCRLSPCHPSNPCRIDRRTGARQATQERGHGCPLPRHVRRARTQGAAVAALFPAKRRTVARPARSRAGHGCRISRKRDAGQCAARSRARRCRLSNRSGEIGAQGARQAAQERGHGAPLPRHVRRTRTRRRAVAALFPANCRTVAR